MSIAFGWLASRDAGACPARKLKGAGQLPERPMGVLSSVCSSLQDIPCHDQPTPRCWRMDDSASPLHGNICDPQPLSLPPQAQNNMNNCLYKGYNRPKATPSTSRYQRLKHAAACHSTYFWGLLEVVLKHAAACRSTLKFAPCFLWLLVCWDTS